MAFLAHLARVVERRDPHSLGHAARVAMLAEVVATRLGWPREEIEILLMGAALHDIGKLGVPRHVLTKPGPLDPDELAEVRSHPERGARMVSLVRPLGAVVSCVLHHHERWDGRGYPTGRAGRAIPAAARVLAVCDAFDAMTSHRPYRAAMSAEEAVAELERHAGTQFDPGVVAVLVRAWREGALAVPAPAAAG